MTTHPVTRDTECRFTPAWQPGTDSNLQRAGERTCELCGKRRKTFKRFGARILRSYSAVCKPCIQEHFSPTTIVVDPSKAGHIARSEWVPSEWMPV